MLSRSISKPFLSCLILSCDSHIDKGGSVFHCLASVLNQNYNNFEIVLVENSHNKIDNIELLTEFCDRLNSKRKQKIPVRFINNQNSISWGAARNKAAHIATGDVLLFLDDDTILLDEDAFEQVACSAEKFDYGYGAIRLWTHGKWFQKNTDRILTKIIQRDYDGILSHASNPQSYVRGEQNTDFQTKTFIANFGFCKRKTFDLIGGFPDFKGYGFEDDYLMFRLFEAGYKYILLNNLRVVHVNHEIKVGNFRSLIPYFENLVKRGYFWFHVRKTFENKEYERSEILENLKTLHYDSRIDESYFLYKSLRPLDISANSINDLESWRNKNIFNKLVFARLIFLLQSSLSLDEFVANSNADFDNLAQVINVAIDYGFVRINKVTGKIVPLIDFQFTKPYELEIVEFPSISIKRKFNQFPCDDKSRVNRFDLIKSRYPYAEYLRFGIIGDDDLLSLQFKNDYWAWPVVIEKDKDIIKIIKHHAPRTIIVNEDVRDFKNLDNIKLQTFITDPPYTLHGALRFIYTGLLMLDDNADEKEFYVILNEAMMGKSFFNLQKVLANSGIVLSEVIQNFSHYKLPICLPERKRANKFLASIEVSSNSLTNSSSSNLYIFKTISPRLSEIEKEINNKLIYEHY